MNNFFKYLFYLLFFLVAYIFFKDMHDSTENDDTVFEQDENRLFSKVEKAISHHKK